MPSGPLIGTIIKPSVGLDAEQTAAEVRKLIDGGIDFIKDDELQADGPNCPFDERVDAVMREVNAGADRLGRKVMYAFNLTGDLDQMKRRHDRVLDLGGSCVMASLNSIGLVGLRELRRHSALPIHAHRNGWGYLSRSPAIGWDYAPWQQLWRLAGADHLHVNGLRQQVQRGRRQRDRGGARGAGAAVAGGTDARHAGLQLRTDRPGGGRHLRRASAPPI